MGSVKEGIRDRAGHEASVARAKAAVREVEAQKAEVEKRLHSTLQNVSDLKEALGVLTSSHEESEARAAKAEARAEKDKEKLSKAREAAKAWQGEKLGLQAQLQELQAKLDRRVEHEQERGTSGELPPLPGDASADAVALGALNQVTRRHQGHHPRSSSRSSSGLSSGIVPSIVISALNGTNDSINHVRAITSAIHHHPIIA